MTERLQEPYAISYRPISIKDFDEIEAFRCGNGSIEQFLARDAYFLHIKREASTTLVFNRDRLLAFFTLQRLKPEFDLASIDGVLDHHQFALDLYMLAVQSSLQGQGIGTQILKYIVDLGYKTNERFITTDALYEKWDWYKKRGFFHLVDSDVNPNSGQSYVYMMMDLYDEALLDDYLPE